jgi:hypothetical protein
MADCPMPTYEELTRWRDAAERGDAASQCRLGGWFAVNAEASLALSVDEVWGRGLHCCLVPISAQPELTLPLSAQLKLTVSPI